MQHRSSHAARDQALRPAAPSLQRFRPALRHPEDDREPRSSERSTSLSPFRRSSPTVRASCSSSPSGTVESSSSASWWLRMRQRMGRRPRGISAATSLTVRSPRQPSLEPLAVRDGGPSRPLVRAEQMDVCEAELQIFWRLVPRGERDPFEHKSRNFNWPGSLRLGCTDRYAGPDRHRFSQYPNRSCAS